MNCRVSTTSGLMIDDPMGFVVDNPTGIKIGKSTTHLFIRNLTQGLVLNVPYFWTSFSQVLVLKVS